MNSFQKIIFGESKTKLKQVCNYKVHWDGTSHDNFIERYNEIDSALTDLESAIDTANLIVKDLEKIEKYNEKINECQNTTKLLIQYEDGCFYNPSVLEKKLTEDRGYRIEHVNFLLSSIK